MVDLSVIVVTFRTDQDLLRRCIASIRAAAGAAEIDAQLIIVDNSADSSLAAFRGSADVWVDTGENLGFARACNIGIEKADAPITLFLNPDATLSAESLSNVSEVVSSTGVPALFCGWLEQNGVTQVDAFMIWWTSTGRLMRRRRYRRLLDAESRTGAPVAVEKVSGGALFGRTKDLRFLGPFDERFFLYGEDVDLSLRGRATGFSLFAHPGVVVEHLASSSMASHSTLVEAARADAAIRLNAYHLPYWASLLTRLEFAAISIVGLFPGLSRTSGSSRARFARLLQIKRWGLRRESPPFRPLAV